MAMTMLQSSRLTHALLCCLILSAVPVDAYWRNPFEQFYPTYNGGLQTIIRNNCSDIYSDYVQNKHNTSGTQPDLLTFKAYPKTVQLIECILLNSPEVVKSKMAAAAVVLGLSPTIVATLGLRPHDTAVLSVIGRRYFLAFAIAVGSPALNAYRMSEFTNVIDELRHESPHASKTLTKLGWTITLTSYLLAAASIANVGQLTYQIGAQTIFTVLPNSPYLALLWAFLGVWIHGMAAVAMRLRVSSKRINPDEKRSNSWPVARAMDQIDLITRRCRIRYTIYPESFVFAIMSVVITVSTACHIIFGTLIFSSIIFISINDSLIILARLMGSAIGCRVACTLELSALRESLEEVSVNETVARPNDNTI